MVTSTYFERQLTYSPSGKGPSGAHAPVQVIRDSWVSTVKLIVVLSVRCPGDIAAWISKFKISMPLEEAPIRENVVIGVRENVVMGMAAARGAAAMAARAPSD
jgi:hypothetical protein